MRRPAFRLPLTALAVLVAGSATVVGLAGPASAGTGSNALSRGERLAAGEYLANGSARLVVQSDGNVVERVNSAVVWTTRTAGRPGAVLTFQTDGNLVLRSTDGVARWSSGTAGRANGDAYLSDNGYFGVYPDSGGAVWDNGVGVHRPVSVLRAGQTVVSGTNPSLVSPDGRIELVVEPNAVTANETVHDLTTVLWEQDGRRVSGSHRGQMTMQTDGNLVLRGPDGGAYWATGTHVRGSSFSVQSDGNFVVRAPSGAALWALGTSRVLLDAGEQVPAGTRFVSKYTFPGPSPYVVFQTDGNLVAHDGNGAVSWSSGTAGHPGSRLAMQRDGNLVIYGADGRGVWSTGTAGCGTGRLFNAQRVIVETSRGWVWSPYGGASDHC